MIYMMDVSYFSLRVLNKRDLALLYTAHLHINLEFNNTLSVKSIVSVAIFNLTYGHHYIKGVKTYTITQV